MERIPLAHPMRRSLGLALLIAVPLVGGTLLRGAFPMPMFVGGTAVAVAAALLFGGLSRWFPGLAFGLVIVPTLIAALAVFGWPFAAVLPVIVGFVALGLFYQPTPPEPPRRSAAPLRSRDDDRAPGYGADHGHASSTSAGGGYTGAGGAFAGAGAGGAWAAASDQPENARDSAGDGGDGGGGGGGD